MAGRLAPVDILSKLQQLAPIDEDVLTLGLQGAVQELLSGRLYGPRGSKNEVDQVVERYLEKIWDGKVMSLSTSTWNE